MPRYERDSIIKILKKEYNTGEILQTLINYPSNLVVTFFSDINLNFPRELRIDVLRKVLRENVLKTREVRATLADEMNYRLSWFNQFTEVQLNNLFNFYKDNELEKNYLEELWLSIIEYITDKSISENDLFNLIDKSKKHAKANGIALENAHKYNNNINSLFYDQKSYIDGLTQDQIRPVLYKSSTITEIRELGTKYDVNVPKRLRKQQLLDIIIAELKDRGEYTESLEDEIYGMNIIVLQRFAMKHNIKASTELKKEEVIEYILANASSTKENYFIPSDSIYEVEAHDIGEAMPEVIIPEVIEEPVVEEVIPVEPIVEPIVEEVTEEPVVEETVEETVEELPVVEEKNMEEPVRVEQQIVHVAHGPAIEKTFDFESVDSTHLNVVGFFGKKPKNFAASLNNFDHDNYAEEQVTNNQSSLNDENKVYKVEFTQSKGVKKPFTLGRFLLRLLINILIILAVIFVVVVIYSGITYKGLPAMEKIELSITQFFNKAFGTHGVNFFNSVRKVIINLFKLS